MYGSVQIGKHLGVSDATIRNWSSEFAAYLSPGSQTAAPGEVRTFTQDDLTILETVAALRRQNLSYDDIGQRLAAGERVEIDAPPIDVKPGQETAVTIAAFQQTLATYENRIDKQQAQIGELYERLTDAEKRAAAAEAKLEILQQQREEKQPRRSFWQRVRGE